MDEGARPSRKSGPGSVEDLVAEGTAVKELFALGLLNLVQWALEKPARMAQVVMVAEKQV